MASGAQSDSEEREVPARYQVTDRRAAARQRQLLIGKARPEYLRYIQCVPKDERTPSCPQTPDPHACVSKRQFDRQLSEWRRLLHEYDDPSMHLEQESRPAEDACLQLGTVFGGGSRTGSFGSNVMPPPGLDFQAGTASLLNGMALGARPPWGFLEAAQLSDASVQSPSMSSSYAPELWPMKVCVPLDGQVFPHASGTADSNPKGPTRDELDSTEGCPVT
eukprot:TRINITY_DN31761_c0_g1_i1.p1 TRINITY_DN31761_c0_g1~~TRINITY_DN31761_c0_g1_i1.p1  ORF type:complete len:232 (-),score=41.42 TRINITY_DN31761_c0_g1_i1:171-830(-)